MLKLLLFLLLAAALITTAIWMHRNSHPLAAETKADRIVVEKGARTLTLFRGTTPLKVYRVALGSAPVGPKRGRRSSHSGRLLPHRPAESGQRFPSRPAHFLSESGRCCAGGSTWRLGRKRHHDSRAAERFWLDRRPPSTQGLDRWLRRRDRSGNRGNLARRSRWSCRRNSTVRENHFVTVSYCAVPSAVMSAAPSFNVPALLAGSKTAAKIQDTGLSGYSGCSRCKCEASARTLVTASGEVAS